MERGRYSSNYCEVRTRSLKPRIDTVTAYGRKFNFIVYFKIILLFNFNRNFLFSNYAKVTTHRRLLNNSACLTYLLKIEYFSNFTTPNLKFKTIMANETLIHILSFFQARQNDSDAHTHTHTGAHTHSSCTNRLIPIACHTIVFTYTYIDYLVPIAQADARTHKYIHGPGVWFLHCFCFFCCFFQSPLLFMLFVFDIQETMKCRAKTLVPEIQFTLVQESENSHLTYV